MLQMGRYWMEKSICPHDIVGQHWTDQYLRVGIGE